MGKGLSGRGGYDVSKRELEGGRERRKGPTRGSRGTKPLLICRVLGRILLCRVSRQVLAAGAPMHHDARSRGHVRAHARPGAGLSRAIGAAQLDCLRYSDRE